MTGTDFLGAPYENHYRILLIVVGYIEVKPDRCPWWLVADVEQPGNIHIDRYM